ncbi:MAG: helix-turn-helix domain-containing protein [Clostridium sp.]|nr:helix-turn-helix domain-containing protein [Clostridium sp.]MCM1172414.1 helix-turn-helix domain-containing protein [Clostridium sp.]MCM1208642.1 helix-turn-helix domain-containing protein [Ruminococcus sp.]
MDITKRIINYIEKNSLSIEVVADKTGVSADLLSDNSKRKLNATEMLEICNYLDIDPKSLL